METAIQYQIWELDRNSGLAHKEDYSSYQRNVQERVVLLEPKIQQTHNSFEEALKEIKEKGDTYTEYTILPKIYKSY